ncbi:hypothetical protein EROP_12210 [Erysipelotrichaceae bacterium OPF54]|nr:hypothetical protein EROP_12210 [Erysipelotrichaceae bacterium OPF54]
MYIHSVKLINYKSIGDYPESEIILEPGITVIIGKNESGKSNVIDGLSKINFLTINEDAFSRNAVNRNIATGSENRFIIIIKSDDRESTLGINVDTTIEITKNKCIVTGGLFEYYLQTIWPEFEEFVKLLNSISENPMQLNASDYSYYKSYKQELINRDNVDLYYKKKAINYFKNKITIFPKGNQDIIKAKLENLITLWDKYTSMFPTFFYRKSDKHLKTTYNIEDIKKELNPNVTTHSLLSELVQLIDISEDDFIFAATTGISSVQESLRSKIVRQIRKKINYPFNDFYGTEYIDLEISFNSGSISFKVQSEDGEALMLSERSDGLKWYLETFIDAQAHDIKGKNVVYLFDEPGTSLHINAQKELLTLFQDLSDKGNQIVYTTHYPHMLDLKNNGIHRIRAIVKNNEGFSNIYKTAYDSRIASESQQDTLAPIINAIGMSLNDTFGPAKDKLNIVVE